MNDITQKKCNCGSNCEPIVQQEVELNCVNKEFFDTKTTEQQIEILRSELKQAIFSLEEAHKKIKGLENHFHSDAGVLLVPLNFNYYSHYPAWSSKRLTTSRDIEELKKSI